jgi:hypothetical protein
MTEVTVDYSKFKLTKLNRDIDPLNLKRITSSLKIKNMLHLRPILVNEEMEIIDGQHRFEAAKSLGLEIYYQITKNNEDHDVVLLNSAQKSWTTDDYVKYYCTKGNQHYIKLVEFAKETGLGVRPLLRLLNVKVSAAGHPIRKGTFRMPEKDSEKCQSILQSLDMMNMIIDYLEQKIIGDKTFLNLVKFKQTLIEFLSLNNVDQLLFLSKVKQRIDIFGGRVSATQYYAMFRDVYNYRNNNPLP